MSPSSRGRGLKFLLVDLLVLVIMSPSSRGRGLKFTNINLKNFPAHVALFTRAWIEIRVYIVLSE